MMDCKKALNETDGDMDEAVEYPEKERRSYRQLRKQDVSQQKVLL